ncbi:MAG: hypothetical protein PHF29_09850 [Candidatus Riflebacteria bacterium]|nr:hypothetical protein [Candidatus Riflebacteria bacterium]
MSDEHKMFIAMIISITVVLLWQIEVIARDRNALVRQAIAYGYAKKVIEHDLIVFKWIIPASATAELK